MVDISKLTFDEAMAKLEEKIKELESDSSESSDKIYQEALELKEYCAKLLNEEREEIVKMAKQNGVELSDLGLEDEDYSDVEESEVNI